MLSYGCTRLEIGVQSTYEDVARDTNRGHTVAAVADCFCLAKDAGFKVCYCCINLHLLWKKSQLCSVKVFSYMPLMPSLLIWNLLIYILTLEYVMNFITLCAVSSYLSRQGQALGRFIGIISNFLWTYYNPMVWTSLIVSLRIQTRQ